MNKEKLTREQKLAKASRNWTFERFGVDETESFGNSTRLLNNFNGISKSSSAETVLFVRADQIVMGVNSSVIKENA